MADPIIPLAYRVLAIQHKRTGLPEDVIVNSWAFQRDAGASVGDMSSLADALATFYAAWPLTRPQSLVEPEMDFRFYHLGEPPPREPVIETRTVPTTDGVALPEEVAMCASFYSERNLPRRRGRVFMGPLTAGIMQTTSGRVKINETHLTTASQALWQLRTLSNVAGWEWSILSQRDVAMYPVTAGWVDDAFDTMRSRGGAAQYRLPFPIP